MTRRNASLAGNRFGQLGLVPWWLSIALATASYLLLHWVATAELPRTKASKAPSPLVAALKGAANAGQFVVPILFVAGAVGSAMRRHRRNALHDVAATGAEAVAGMSWAEFEVLVGEAFRRRGYHVEETGGGGADGGVDLVLRRGGDKVFVQCKQWKAYKVGVTVVRELAGVMAVHGAARGFVVTSGRFTAEAEAFGKQGNVSLIDGVALAELIASTRRQQATPPSVAQRIEPTLEPVVETAAPSCPLCQRQMVRRLARRGSNEGKEFWGCPTFPACKGIRAID
ncbi:MAG: restriction endonuclease [Burkholderiaceae bacterium]|nr:restriction endonuclease [Burkholderiaceae bacterium]